MTAVCALRFKQVMVTKQAAKLTNWQLDVSLS